MTILEALQWANNKLKKSGVESPMLDAEVLLSHLLGISKAGLFSHFTDPLKQHHQEQFNTLIVRRSSFEPIAYLIGKKPFFGRDFAVNPFVLIPRPATECLVTEALAQFANTEDPEKSLFVDIGTGSGAIAISLAAETQSPVVATDLSPHALSVAEKNAAEHGVRDLIDFRQGSLLDPIIELFETMRSASAKPVSSVYPFKHLVVCANLPYLTDNQMETLQPDVRKFEPHEALKAGPDGIEAYWQLFKQFKKNREALPRHIVVLIEIDPSQTTRAVELIEHQFPESRPEIKKDLQGLHRIVIASI